jgi:D-beta-D-heptose 7-phosphate kinase/D-beta-D-heptose 1-phosphate adenosyltransferase
MNILIIGDSCIDVYVYGKADRLCPEAPVPVFIPKRETRTGGMAANVFENIESLEVDVHLVTNENPVTKTRYVEEKTNHQIIRIDSETSSIPRIKNLDKIKFGDYDAVIISDYNKGLLTYEDIQFICKSHSAVFIDTKKIVNEYMLDAKFIKINEYEYANNIAAGQYFKEFYDKLIVTMSGKGCKYMETEYNVDEVEVRDNSGAGDTFISGLVVEWCRSGDIGKAILYANECATIVVQHKGVTKVGNYIKK